MYTLKADVYEKYDNMKCYPNEDGTGEVITPTSTTGTNGKLYTYELSDVTDIYYVNSSNYYVAFFNLVIGYGEKPAEEPEPELEEITIAEALEKADGTPVMVRGTVSEINSAWNSDYGDMNVTITDGQNTLFLYCLAKEVALGDIIVVTGTMGTYGGQRQIDKKGTAEIVDKDETVITISFNAGEGTGSMNSESGTRYTQIALPTSTFTAPNGKVFQEWNTSSDGTGTSYQPEQKLSLIESITLYAIWASEGEQLTDTAEISFADVANRTSFSTTEQVWKQNGITVTNTKGSSTSNIADYSNPARFYKNSSLTVSYTAQIIKVEITCNTAAYATALDGSAFGEGVTHTVSGKVVTLTFAAEVTEFTVQLTGGQIRVDSIKVTYIQSEQPEHNHEFVNGECACGEKDPNYVAPEQPDSGEQEPAESWTLVTNASELQVGDQIVIVATKSDVALSTTQNGNNRGQAAVTKNGNVVTFGDDVQIITLEAGTVANTFAFSTDAGYLYAASSSKNYLRSQETINDNASWSIEITPAGIATIKAQGTNTRNWLRYNSDNSIFSAYGSGQLDISIYKLSK